MKEVFDKIDNLKEAIDKVNDERYSEIFNSINDVLVSLATKIDEVILIQEYLEENLGYIDDDLTDIQEELFEELTLEELEELDDEYVEVQCEHCGKPLFVEQKTLDENLKIPCPFCNRNAK